MSRKVISICIMICLINSKLEGQVNYVLNASLEDHWRCPVILDEIKFANYWSSIDTINTYPSLGDTFGCPGCMPDYINVCAVSGDVSAPWNVRFYQYPRTGSGMAQVQMYVDESISVPYKRDYLQGRLMKNLTSGKSYCITFYVSFKGSNAGIPSGYAVDHIGAYLDNGSIDLDTGMQFCGQPHPLIIPQLYSTSIIIDTSNWTKIQGSFTASGSEKFITIGNFFDKNHTNVISYTNGSPISVYLVDDVSVIESTEVAHAGADGIVWPGSDSVWIGTHEEGMPCTWYIMGNTTPIGYSGGFKVHPSVTTTYVVEIDLCGHITYDTVVVHVPPAGVATPLRTTLWAPQLSPNPAHNEVYVTDAKGCELSIYDMMGRQVCRRVFTSDQETMDLSLLESGVYEVLIVDPVSGERVVRKIIKE